MRSSRRTFVAVLSAILLGVPLTGVGSIPPASASPLATSISAGAEFSCAIASSGGPECWGQNYFGELGNGTRHDSSTPVPVSGLGAGVIAISAGSSHHACAITSAHGLRCWGENDTGQLGDTTTIQRETPVDVSGLTSGVVAVSAASGFTCAVTSAGGAKCWGENYAGQLGDGTRIERRSPVDVSGLGTGVAAISGGGRFACALTTAGGVKCWGDNYYGELGNGTRINRLRPVQVSGLTSGVASISAGGDYACALMISGALKCWGNNEWGELGDGTDKDTSTPVAVTGLGSGVAAISTTGGADEEPEVTCALTSSGALMCWGWGISLRASWIKSRIPVSVQGLPGGTKAVSVGQGHVCTLTTSGDAMCWGFNRRGQVGDGTHAYHYTAVFVRGLVGPLPVPRITAVSPHAGWVGSSLTVRGSGLIGTTEVTIGGTPAFFKVISETELVAHVPVGSSTGSLILRTPGGSATSGQAIVVHPPKILSVSPSTSRSGSNVVIFGRGLWGASKVLFNGAWAPFRVLGGSRIQTRVPPAATNGRVNVITNEGEATSPKPFILARSPGGPLPGTGELIYSNGNYLLTLKAGSTAAHFVPRFTGDAGSITASPDGSRVALTVPYSSAGPDILVIATKTGRSVHLIGGDGDEDPDWSPDGTRIAWAGLNVTKVGAWTTKSLSKPGYPCTDQTPSWSHDSSHVVFYRACYEGKRAGIYVVGARGRALHRLIQSPPERSHKPWPGLGSEGIPTALVWSPRGPGIVFQMGDGSLWRMKNAPGSKPRRIVAPGPHYSATQDALAVSPGGRFLAFYLHGPTSGIRVLDLVTGRLRIVRGTGYWSGSLSWVK